MFGMTSYYFRLPPALGVEGYNATIQTVILLVGNTRLATDFPRSLSAGVSGARGCRRHSDLNACALSKAQ